MLLPLHSLQVNSTFLFHLITNKKLPFTPEAINKWVSIYKINDRFENLYTRYFYHWQHFRGFTVLPYFFVYLKIYFYLRFV